MRVSISVTAFPSDVSYRRYLTDLGAAADEAGIDTLWLADHLVQAQPQQDFGEPMLEAYTAMGFLLGRTERVRLGAMVSPATVRVPALLVKMVSTLAVLGEGRVWLGVGAGYQHDEARAMGLDLPARAAERYERLAELLALAKQMATGDRSPVAGAHLALDCPYNEPRPSSRVPILIGGAGEKRTLPLVARFGDACNLFDIPDDGATLRRKLAVLDDACTRIGRDPAEIERTVSSFWPAERDPAELIQQCRRLSGYGAGHVVLLRADPWTATDVARLTAVVRAVDDHPFQRSVR